MAIQTNVEGLQVRFGLQLELLRQLFKNSNLPFGTPENLASFAERLDTPGTFANDTRVLLTAVICTEQPTLTRMELLDLLCLAVCGTTADGSGVALRPALWQILIFINGVLLSGHQATLPETVRIPARAVEEAPQIDGFEQDAYVLERFDPPSVLPWVVSGRDSLEIDLRQATLPETAQIPARSAEGAPQMDGFEQDAYVLERFDLPSDLPLRVSGMEALNDLEGKHSLDTYLLKETNSCEGAYKPESIHKEFLARANSTGDIANGLGDHSLTFETVLLDEKPVVTAMATHGSISTVSQVATDRPRRETLLGWPASLAFGAVAGFLLGTLVPRYATPCSATPALHGANRADTSATSAVTPGLFRAFAQRSKLIRLSRIDCYWTSTSCPTRHSFVQKLTAGLDGAAKGAKLKP